MKKLLMTTALSVCLLSGTAHAARVHDWKDLDRVHNKIVASIHDMEHARAANHYDMDGHGAKAEELLRQAEHELGAAIESSKQHAHDHH